MKQPVIVAACRTPIGRAFKGKLAHYRPDDLGGMAIKGVMERVPECAPAMVEDVVFGCAMPEGEQGMNIANISKFVAGLPYTTSAMTVNRFCSSGLQTIALAHDSIASGRHDVVVAGGAESMSMVPMGGNKVAPNPDIVDEYPEVYLSMGLTAERVAEKFKISREDQDAFGLRSHELAIKAMEAGYYKEETIPIEYQTTLLDEDQNPVTQTIRVEKDEGPRASTLEQMEGLRTVFKQTGKVTAGTSSQMSDGAAAALLMSQEKADELGVKPIAKMLGFNVAGVEPELMGIGPTKAIPKVLEKTGLTLEDIDLIELNEAFAAQSLAVMKELKLDPAKVNVNGGAIAYGHPLGATGAILTVRLLHEMRRRKARYGMVTMCIGGGMGAAGIFELL
jgi:acetyl-CoA acyltransferase